MAIIYLDTVGNADPPMPTVPTLEEGVPLDFGYFAVRKYGDESLTVDEAIAKAREEFLESLSASRTESVPPDRGMLGGRLITNPCLYATPTAIDDRERIPSEWLDLVNQRRASIEGTLRSVGRIQLHHFESDELAPSGYEVGLVIGTGVVVAPRIVMTNRHVAELFAQIESSQFNWRRDERTNEPMVLIDFGGDSNERSNLHRVERVLYMTAKPSDPDVETEPDVALLELGSSEREPSPPVPLQLTPPSSPIRDRRAFVVGYPTIETNLADWDRVRRMFRLFRVKRVSLGTLHSQETWKGLDRLLHDCTTLGGSSGSPLIDFETGTVWGLHYNSYNRRTKIEGNMAEPMWRIYELPPVRDLLGSAPKARRAPLEPLRQPPRLVAEKQSRPVLFTQANDIARKEPFPDDWFEPDSPEHQHIRNSLPTVGLVRVENDADQPGTISTGFLAAPDIVITFLGGFKPKSRRSKRRRGPGLSISFTSSLGETADRGFVVSEILYNDESLTLLRLAPPSDQPLPPPLPLQQSRPPDSELIGTNVFVVGHPAAQAREVSPEVGARIFPPPYGVKRLALGKLLGEDSAQHGEPQPHLLHDCSTTAGDGGAPIVSLASGQVLGMHIGGQYLQSNFALPMWSILANAKVQKFLV